MAVLFFAGLRGAEVEVLDLGARQAWGRMGCFEGREGRFRWAFREMEE